MSLEQAKTSAEAALSTSVDQTSVDGTSVTKESVADSIAKHKFASACEATAASKKRPFRFYHMRSAGPIGGISNRS
ncbi:MAG: hypothetical protein ACPGLY_27310 [Rubripirellula sp.]